MELKESISEKEGQLLKVQEALKETTELKQKVRCSFANKISIKIGQPMASADFSLKGFNKSSNKT